MTDHLSPIPGTHTVGDNQPLAVLWPPYMQRSMCVHEHTHAIHTIIKFKLKIKSKLVRWLSMGKAPTTKPDILNQSPRSLKVEEQNPQKLSSDLYMWHIHTHTHTHNNK